jgi:hypothetical protein
VQFLENVPDTAHQRYFFTIPCNSDPALRVVPGDGEGTCFFAFVIVTARQLVSQVLHLFGMHASKLAHELLVPMSQCILKRGAVAHHVHFRVPKACVEVKNDQRRKIREGILAAASQGRAREMVNWRARNVRPSSRSQFRVH